MLLPKIFGEKVIWFTFLLYEAIVLMVAVALVKHSERIGRESNVKEKNSGSNWQANYIEINRGESLDIHIKDAITYIAFEVKGNMFAILIYEILYVMELTQKIPYTILPGASNYVKCIVETDGILITVVNMPGIDGIMVTSGDFIVVLNLEQPIGISANVVYLVTISSNEIMEDAITGTRSFMSDGNTYYILDVCQLYKYLGL